MFFFEPIVFSFILDRDSSEAPRQSLEVKVEVTDAKTKKEAQSDEKEKDDSPENKDVIDLISDEDDVICVTTERETEKMETAVDDGAQERADAGKMKLTHREALQRFLRKYCSDSDALTDSHPALRFADITHACRQAPYCLYVYVGVDLGEGFTTSVVLVGFFDRNSEVRVVRPLLTLQMSVDTGADVTADADADARLLIDRLRSSGLASSNLAMFHCEAQNPKLCRALVSMLQAVNSKCLFLCGLTGIAERACDAAFKASFHHVVPLIADIHRHYSPHATLNKNLQHVFAGVGAYNTSPAPSRRFAIMAQCVKRMVETWRGLVDYFKSAAPEGDVDTIRTRLMDHEIKLHFLFLAYALEPLRTLHEFQQQAAANVATQLKMVSMLVYSYADNLLEVPAKEAFVSRRDPQILQNQKNLLQSQKLNIGPNARDFLWATAVVDLGEAERADFLEKATTFYKVALQSLTENLPKQLGDGAMKNISSMLKHPEDLKVRNTLKPLKRNKN